MLNLLKKIYLKNVFKLQYSLYIKKRGKKDGYKYNSGFIVNAMDFDYFNTFVEEKKETLMEEIKEKELVEAVKEKEDTKKDKFSTRVLVTLTAGVVLALLIYGIKELFFSCGVSNCYLGGASMGSVIVTVIWLIANHLKP